MLQLHMCTTASNGDCIRLASVQVFYNPSERIGQLRSEARKRRHTFCEQRGGVYVERNAAIQQYGLCMRNMDALMYPKLTTVAEEVLCLSSCERPIFTWTVPEEAAFVLKLVRAFV